MSDLIVPGLGCNLFSVKQAARNGVVSIFDMTNPRLETHNHALPPQELGHNLDFFSLELAGVATGRSWQYRLRQTPTCGIVD